MDTKPVKSARGVYYDLSKSPYEYQTPYGDLFKFSSQKKLDIYTRDIIKEVARLDKALTRNNLIAFIPAEISQLLERAAYSAFYKKIEG